MLAYGVFCSRHTEAIQVYKCMMKTESKFQLLCKVSCRSLVGLMPTSVYDAESGGTTTRWSGVA